MARYSSRADKLQAARRELRSIYVGGLTLFTVLYVAVGLGLPYVQDLNPDWRVTPEVTGWYWIIGFGVNMVGAVLTWAVVAALSRHEAERRRDEVATDDAAAGSPAAGSPAADRSAAEHPVAEHPVAEHPVAERDQASNGAAPLPPRRSDYGPLTQLVPVLLS
ncbi:MAG: hypothetical protein ACYC6V_09855, partial [Bacillota bacterium]